MVISQSFEKNQQIKKRRFITMKKDNTNNTKGHFTSRAALLALGVKIEQLGILQPMMEQVEIKQKTVKDTPNQKLLDGLITILAGAHGLVEANKRVRTDPTLQRAFGRKRCAEQSVISETLDACTEHNVTQMEQAMKTIYQRHSQGYQHDYEQEWQLLDIDLSGQPCGKKAEFATKAYFAKQRNRRGRQLARVLASWYQEIVVDRIYEGKTILPVVLQELIAFAADVLALDSTKKQRTILRIDGHGGSQADINWMLSEGYQIHTKEYSGKRAVKLAQSVVTWHDDPYVPGRQVGWVECPASEYSHPVKRIAVRTLKKNGKWAIGVLISSLSFKAACYLAGLPAHQHPQPQQVLLAYVQLYDQRGGGVETTFREDKQGLGITKRNKKRFNAQAVMTQLNALAHNLIVWFRNWLTQYCQTFYRLGILRMIRDVFHMNAFVSLDEYHSIIEITLTQFDPFAVKVFDALRQLLLPAHVDVNLGEI
jgi:hypothetical protein